MYMETKHDHYITTTVHDPTQSGKLKNMLKVETVSGPKVILIASSRKHVSVLPSK